MVHNNLMMDQVGCQYCHNGVSLSCDHLPVNVVACSFLMFIWAMIKRHETCTRDVYEHTYRLSPQEGCMHKLNIPLIGVLIIVSAACTLPAPDKPVTPSPPGLATDPGPSATLPVEISPQPTQTEIKETTTVISPTENSDPKVPTQTLEAVETSQPEITYRFVPQTGTPIGIENFLHPEAGCSWMGVGGQVFSQNDRPINDLIVEVGGSLEGSPILLLTMTGDSTALGPGGYEVRLAEKTVATQGSLWLQLHDLNGKPQSEKVYFDTYNGDDACEKNLVIINFNELRKGPVVQYLPSIFRGP
jgi:hypothetical protein